MKYIGYVLALIGGLLLSIQSALYGQLGQIIGQLETSFYNFLAGTILLVLLWLFLGVGKISEVSTAPKWALLGGVFGVFYLTAIVISVPFTGVGIAMVSLIIGQLTMSMIIEHYGWFGSRRAKVNKEKILAVLCMAIALILI